jgi:hypothetical protein
VAGEDATPSSTVKHRTKGAVAGAARDLQAVRDERLHRHVRKLHVEPCTPRPLRLQPL